jgi:transposase
MGGELYLFVNVKRTGCKVLVWDGTGLCILMKKLERGRFADLWAEGGGTPVRLTPSELAPLYRGLRAGRKENALSA